MSRDVRPQSLQQGTGASAGAAVVRAFYVGVTPEGQPYLTDDASLANAALVDIGGALGVDDSTTDGLSLALKGGTTFIVY